MSLVWTVDREWYEWLGVTQCYYSIALYMYRCFAAQLCCCLLLRRQSCLERVELVVVVMLSTFFFIPRSLSPFSSFLCVCVPQCLEHFEIFICKLWSSFWRMNGMRLVSERERRGEERTSYFKTQHQIHSSRCTFALRLTTATNTFFASVRLFVHSFSALPFLHIYRRPIILLESLALRTYFAIQHKIVICQRLATTKGLLKTQTNM